MSRSKTISMVNLGGGNVVSMLDGLLKALPKNAKKILVEFPCLGIPKLSYAFNQVRIDKETTIDQMLLDYDREEKKAVEDYIFSGDGLDFLLINPRALPEVPTIRKIRSNKTLIDLPLYLKLQLQEKYDYVIFVLQGTLVHPMTHFALRCSDHIILHNTSALDFVPNYTNFLKLNDIFGVGKERMSLYSEDTNLRFDEERIYTRIQEIMKRIDEQECYLVELVSETHQSKLNNESIGIINPLDFLDYKFQRLDISTEISKNEMKSLEELAKQVRYHLRNFHVDDFINAMYQKEARMKVCYFISDYIREQNQFTFEMNLNDVIEWVQKDITGLGVLQEVLENDNITNIDINGLDQVIVEDKGITVHREEICFQSVDHMYQIIDKILMPIGKPISSNEPIIDANYKGFRVNVIADTKTYAGVSARYPLISIRKFPPRVFSDEECIQYGNISKEISDFLKFIVPCGANIIISGGTNSGKTTQLIRLPLYVDRLTRILSIEDSEEMMLAYKEQYQNYPNLPSLLVKDIEDKERSYGIDKLIKAALRQNPDIMIIGEVRDESAARQSLIGMNTGHIVWLTIHANSAKEAATRILQLNGNTLAAASQIGSSVDLIVFQKKLKNGARVVTEICELLGYKGVEEPVLNPIFRYDYKKQIHVQVGKITSENMLEKIDLHGVNEDIVGTWCRRSKEEVAP
ncbi:hypothetical protein J6TS7_32580 [Paenibacillus dendritiformis]|uniref:CpaF family protein n=1 Tax=Paenibacillus TaxID=44249 RepID=UPI001B29E24B|nr:ATPase, T2SS/T4P/T4SS family [Paenibacillus dendritiformis]GIO79648.1 hypothetical protein J6TS7_32580 [Paenibacillus dendritiformis]